MKITWFLSGPSPATWGRVVDGKIDAVGKAIAAMPAKAAAKAAARSAGAKAEAKAEAKVTELSMATLLSWCFFNINVLIQDYKSSQDMKNCFINVINIINSQDMFLNINCHVSIIHFPN